MIDWFYSDPHFGHANVMEYAGRPFATIEEHDEELVRRYNAVVGPGDVAMWCGDVCLASFEHGRGILARLNGRKLLVVGNHDRSPGRMAEMGFAAVARAATVHMAGRTVQVSHYPYERDSSPAARYMERRVPRVKGEALIHGHLHSRKRRVGNEVHVGVDAWGYRPVQDLAYGVPAGEVRVAVFDLFVGTEWHDARDARMLGADLPWVPFLGTHPFDPDALAAMAEGPSTVPGAGHVREGVVVKPLRERFDLRLGRANLKYVGCGYLERKGGG